MKICGIYCIFNKVNHKRYIGQSVDINARWSKHKKLLSRKTYNGDNHHLTNAWHKYGENNFDFFIVERCKKSELNAFETFWVNYYETTDPNKGYNKTMGGKYNYQLVYSEQDKISNIRLCGEKHGCHILTEENVKQIIKLFETGVSSISIAKQFCVNRATITAIRKHKAWTCLTKGLNLQQSDYYNTHNMINSKAKIIDMYTLDGIFVKTFPSINQAAEELKVKNSNISKVCYGKNVSILGYVFRFHGCAFDSLKTKKQQKATPVDQYDLAWNYIQSFNSIKDAYNNTGVKNISYILSHPSYTGGGYHWLRQGQQPPKDMINNKMQNKWVAVDQYDANWNFINSYPSIKHASIETKIKQGNISSVITGRQYYAGGYHWLRHNEQPPIAM